jgi:hypothetical protein
MPLWPLVSSPAALVLALAALGTTPRPRVDLAREPWGRVLDLVQHEGDGPAQRALERIGGDGALAAWERAHAWRWAGQLAVRGGRLGEARRAFHAARTAEPEGFEARMATVHLGEVAIRERRWFEAERWLRTVAHDADPIVATYATDRLTAVRERTLRLVLRYGALAWLAVGAAALAWRLWRRERSAHTGRDFARALLVTEGAAIAGAVLVPRVTTSLAGSGWMAFALPAALVLALVWATRRTDASRGQRAATGLLLGLSLAAGLYLALDYTWWAVARPVLH